jgi:hypothetical protein
VAVCVPAAMAPMASASALKLAVMVAPFIPNDTLFEFENVMAETLLLVVPAEKFTPMMSVPFVFGSQSVSLAD